MAIGLMMSFTQLSATVWRVNGTPNSSAHYLTLQAAHDAATTLDGDTLYLEGSMFSTGGISCYKKLCIIGSGYFLDQNPETQHNKYPSTIDGYIYYYSSSSGSKLMGCTVPYSVYLYASNITFERNHFPSTYSIYQQSGNLSNIRIIDNYFSGAYYYPSLAFGSPITDVLISNNYFYGYITTNANFSGMVMNNIFYTTVDLYNSNVINNISMGSSATLTNCIVAYNIGTSTQFPAGNNNQQNVPLVDLFVGLTGNSTDGQWQLKPGSPAIGAGEGGVDCGIFGGAYPYVLSGLPAIPAIYFFDAPSLPSGTINVTIKAKSHN